MDPKDKRYTYDRFGMKGARVGQAVHDILSSSDTPSTVEEILDSYALDYVRELEDTIEKNEHRYTGTFHVFVLSNKEMWATNVVRNWFIARQTAPDALEMVCQYPNHVKILYSVDKKTNEVKLLWTIPGVQDCVSILNNPNIYDPMLVKWINECFSGLLKDKNPGRPG